MEEKLNSLVIKYQETKDDSIFSAIYHEVIERLGDYQDIISNRYDINAQDIESELNYKILTTAMSYAEDKGNYITYVRRAVRFMKADFVRGKPNNNLASAVNSLEHSTVEDIEGVLQSTVDVMEIDGLTDKDVIDTERNLIHSMDQRQLVDKLLEVCSEESRQAILAFKETGNFYNAAKILGICNKTVERRIRKIASHFDGNQFGSYHDYLTA